MPDVREEFEAAIFAEVNEQRAAEGDFLLQTKEGLCARDEDGSYSIRWVNSAWWAWQASRAALKVELPKLPPHANSIGDYARGFMAARSASKEALQQAGIEVVK